MAASLRIAARGTWLYDDEVEKPVDVIALDYDWWYSLAEADGTLDDTEKPAELGPDGYLYYVRFKRAGESTVPTWVDTAGYPTVVGAIRAAEEQLGREIKWENYEIHGYR